MTIALTCHRALWVEVPGGGGWIEIGYTMPPASVALQVLGVLAGREGLLDASGVLDQERLHELSSGAADDLVGELARLCAPYVTRVDEVDSGTQEILGEVLLGEEGAVWSSLAASDRVGALVSVSSVLLWHVAQAVAQGAASETTGKSKPPRPVSPTSMPGGSRRESPPRC